MVYAIAIFWKRRRIPDSSTTWLESFEVAETSQAVRLLRKLWIERSSMHLVRQQYYDSGERVSSITYDHTSEIDGVLIPFEIEIKRERENYRIALKLAQEGIKVNQSVREGSF